MTAPIARELGRVTPWRNSDAGYQPATGVLGGKTGVASLGVPDVGASESYTEQDGLECTSRRDAQQ